MQPLRILEYPWKIVGIDNVTDLPKGDFYGHTTVFIMVYHLTKMSHFVPCHMEITAKESANFFLSNCYGLHGVSKIIVSGRYPMFVGKFLAFGVNVIFEI